MNATPTESQLEAEMQSRKLDAPRLSPQAIDAAIVRTHYFRVPDTTTTVCVLVLVNGFTVVGKSACVSPANFDESIGQRVAFDDARRQVWELEGYRLQQSLFDARLDAVGND